MINPNAPCIRIYEHSANPQFIREQDIEEELAEQTPPTLQNEIISDLAPNPEYQNNVNELFNQEPQGPIEPNYELNEERKRLINNLSSYRYSRFYQRIIDVYPNIFNDIEKKSNDELKQDIELIKTYIRQRRSSEHFKNQFNNILIGVDTVCTNILSLEVDGAREILMNDEDVLDTLEEVRLKYDIDCQLEPEVVLATTICATYLRVNAKNQMEKRLRSDKMKQGIQNELNKPCNKNLEEEFSDI